MVQIQLTIEEQVLVYMALMDARDRHWERREFSQADDITVVARKILQMS